MTNTQFSTRQTIGSTTPPPPRRRRARTMRYAVAALLTAGLTLTQTGAAPDHASAADGTGRTIETLNMRTDATTTAAIIGVIPKGTVLRVNCTRTGTSVTGPYGATNLWDQVTWNGATGFVTDAYMFTGTASAVAPPCGPTPPVTNPPTASKADRAVQWALSMVGKTGYNAWCERFVENAYGTQHRYGSALANYNAQLAAGRIRTTRTGIPAGSLVFFRSSGDGGYGHVEIAVGDGTFVTSAARVSRVNLAWGGRFLGWAPAPSNWPGR